MPAIRAEIAYYSSSFGSQRLPHPGRVEVVVAQFRLIQGGVQHRHQLVETGHQRRVGVDIDHRDGERPFGRLQQLQRVQHVLAEVAVAAAIQSEMHGKMARGRPGSRGRPLWTITWPKVSARQTAPRRTSTTDCFLVSSLATAALNCLASLISTLFSCSTTSPARMPALAATPSTSSTTAPPSRSSSFFCAALRSLTLKPSALEAASAFGLSLPAATLAGLSDGSSAMVTGKSS